ncbi:hypothetical protein DYB37_007638 [Aphanomyces astaci]|uniref:Uncharacterized protein n=1 Tax=Aphanomyces astaci TaxID=112090 RepID=A0A3R7CA55_APHAT|nr:hypothetical protein DYB37_007638 [Aphanomyces astaci]
MATTTPTEHDLTNVIKSVTEQNPTFGSKRILAAVKVSHADWIVGEKRIAKLLKKLNLGQPHNDTPLSDNQSSDDDHTQSDSNSPVVTQKKAVEESPETQETNPAAPVSKVASPSVEVAAPSLEVVSDEVQAEPKPEGAAVVAEAPVVDEKKPVASPALDRAAEAQSGCKCVIM